MGALRGVVRPGEGMAGEVVRGLRKGLLELILIVRPGPGLRSIYEKLISKGDQYCMLGVRTAHKHSASIWENLTRHVRLGERHDCTLATEGSLWR